MVLVHAVPKHHTVEFQSMVVCSSPRGLVAAARMGHFPVICLKYGNISPLFKVLPLNADETEPDL